MNRTRLLPAIAGVVLIAACGATTPAPPPVVTTPPQVVASPPIVPTSTTTTRTTSRVPAATSRSLSSRAPAPGGTTGSALLVHAGSFCATPGATGVTSKGTVLRCRAGSDGRDRWGK